MSEDSEEVMHSEENVNCCRQCGSSNVEEGYKFKLCKECRDRLVKRPIPMKIKLFFLIVIIISLISLANFPKTLQSGVEYERALRAEGDLKYITAMKHYENVIKDYPNSQKTLVKLYSIYYRNREIEKADNILEELRGPGGSTKTVDKAVANEVNSITHKLDLYYSVDKELDSKLNSLENPKPEELVALIKPYVDKGKELTYGAYLLADAYYDLNKFDEAITVLNKITDKYPDFYTAGLLKASCYRELGKYDEAVSCCKNILAHNVEDIDANVSLSKIELKRKNNEGGLKYAQYAYELDSNDPYVISNLSLAFHFNNKINERDELFNQLKSLKDKDEYTMNLLTSIFNGTLQWQK